MRRRRRRKQRKIIIISSLTLLFIMTIGYAAFQTNINITAKGNILEKGITIDELKNKVTTSGDGLYQDTLESGRYVYKGANPDNYILFNNELWRIVALENDNTIKIIRKDSVNVLYDLYTPTEGRRLNSNNTYCKQNFDVYYGCNAWNSVSGNYTSSGTTGTVTQDAELNIYLNGTFYNNINDKDRSLIVKHTFYKGPVNGVDTNISPGINDVIKDEQTDSWTGFIGLPNLSDWFKSSSNSNCLSSTTEWVGSNDRKCPTNNYMQGELTTVFMSPDNRTKYNHSLICSDNQYGLIGCNGGYVTTDKKTSNFPALFITANITLKSQGTSEKPYTIITT